MKKTKKKMNEKRKYEVKLRRQEEFGEKLIQNRGKIFTIVLVIFLGLMYLVIKNASIKKDKII